MSQILRSALLLCTLWTMADSSCADSKRVRKPWHSLKFEDQMLYVEGFQLMRSEGKLVDFMESHEKATSSDTYNIHATPQNLFWHSYWLYELEDEIRDLGDRFECFTLPYWDVTHDALAWDEMVEPKNINALPIYSSNLGANGNLQNNNCVEDDPWTVDQYATDALCADDEEADSCCLKRFHADNATMAERKKFSDVVFVNQSLAEYKPFLIAISVLHEQVHNFFASIGGTHFNTRAGDQVSDPLFPLFHSFLEYLRLLREDCYQFDTVPSDELDDYIPYAFDNAYGKNITLDYPMDFSVLCDGSSEQKIRFCSYNEITPRLMYDVSPNRGFGIIYELGDFWSTNDALKASCNSFLNATWWSVDETETDDDTDAVFLAQSEGVEYELVADGGYVLGAQRSSSRTVMLMVAAVGVVVMMILRSCGRTMGKGQELMEGGGESAIYGAI